MEVYCQPFSEGLLQITLSNTMREVGNERKER